MLTLVAVLAPRNAPSRIVIHSCHRKLPTMLACWMILSKLHTRLAWVLEYSLSWDITLELTRYSRNSNLMATSRLYSQSQLLNIQDRQILPQYKGSSSVAVYQDQRQPPNLSKNLMPLYKRSIYTTPANTLYDEMLCYSMCFMVTHNELQVQRAKS